MRRLKFLGLALLAVFASAAALSASASALVLPEILPLSATERTWTGKNDAANPKLVSTSGSETTCESATATGTEEAGKPLGLFHIEFKGCGVTSPFPAKCTGLGDATTGVILSLGTWHLVFDKTTPELLTATLFLLDTVHFTCGGIVLVEVKGNLVCLDLEPTVKKAEHLFHCTQTAGVPADKEYFNDSGVKVTPKLECSENGGAFKECAELALGTVLYKVEVFTDI
jgi:hypothetical protein